MVDYIPQTRHPRLFLVMLASIGYTEGAGVMCLNNLINKFFCCSYYYLYGYQYSYVGDTIC